MSSYDIARERLESLQRRGLLDDAGPGRSQPLIRQPPQVRSQLHPYGNKYAQADEYPSSHNYPPARAPLLGRRPALPATDIDNYEENQCEIYQPPEKRPLLEYDPQSERGFHEIGRGFGRGRGLLSRGQGQYSRGRGGISHSRDIEESDEYEGFDTIGHSFDSIVTGNESIGRGIIRGRGVNMGRGGIDMRGRGFGSVGRGIGANTRGSDSRGRGVNTRGRDVDIIGRANDTIGRGIELGGRGSGANGSCIDSRGRGLDTRGRGTGINTRGRGYDTRGRGTGIDTRGRGFDTRGRGTDIDTRGRGYDTRGRGTGIDTRGRGFDTRGRGTGIDTRGRGFDTRGRGTGIDTRGRGLDSRGRGFDTRGRGNDVRGRGFDARGRGNDVRGRGFDARGRGNDVRGRGFDARGRGIDSRGRGINERGRGISMRGQGSAKLQRGEGHSEHSENTYDTGKEGVKEESDSSSKNVLADTSLSVAKQEPTLSTAGTTEERVQEKEKEDIQKPTAKLSSESGKAVTSKTPVQEKAGMGRGLAACLMNVVDTSPVCKKEEKSCPDGVEHQGSCKTNKHDGTDISNVQLSAPDPSSKPGHSTQSSSLKKEIVNTYCEPCKSFFSVSAQYDAHLKSEAHLSRVSKRAVPAVDIVTKVKQSAELTLVKHNQSKAVSESKPPVQNQPSVRDDNNDDSDSDDDDTRCKVCNMNFDDRGKYLRHTKGLMHTQKKIEYDKAKGSTKYDDVKETASDKPFAFGSGSSGQGKPWLRNQSEGYKPHTGYGAQKGYQPEKRYDAYPHYDAHRGHQEQARYEDNAGYEVYPGYDEADRGCRQTEEWGETEEREMQHSSRNEPVGLTKRMRDAGITEEMLAESEMAIPKLDPAERDLQPNDVGRLQFPDSYHCKLCDAKCTSAVTFQSHLAGAKHKSNVLSASKGRKIKLKQKKRVSVVSLTKTSKIEDIFNDKSCGDHAVIGLDYITEFQTQDPRATIVCVCNLCESKCDENTVASHVMGLKHKIKYMKEKHPVMYEHFKKFGGKKSQQTAFAEELAVEVMKQDGRGRITVRVEVDSGDEGPEHMAQREAEAAKKKEQEPALKQQLQQQMNQAIERFGSPTIVSSVGKQAGPRTQGTFQQEEKDFYGRGQGQGHSREHDEVYEYGPRGRGHDLYGDQIRDLQRRPHDYYPMEHERGGDREARRPYERNRLRGEGYPGYDERSRSPYESHYRPKPELDVMEKRRLDDLLRRGLITEEERRNMERTKIAEMEKLATTRYAESRPIPTPSQQTHKPEAGQSHRDDPDYLQFLAERQRKQEQQRQEQGRKDEMNLQREKREQQLERKQTKQPHKQEEAVPQIGDLLSTLSSSMISSEDEAAVALQVSNALTQALLSYRLRSTASEVKNAGIAIPPGFTQESCSPGQSVPTSGYHSTGPPGFTQPPNPPFSSSPGSGNSHGPPHSQASGGDGYGIPSVNTGYVGQEDPKPHSHIQPDPTSVYQANVQPRGYQPGPVAAPCPLQPPSQFASRIQPCLPSHIQPSGSYQEPPLQQPGPVQPPTSSRSKLPGYIKPPVSKLPSVGTKLPGHIQGSSSYQPQHIQQSGSIQTQASIQPRLPGHLQPAGQAQLPGHIQPTGLFHYPPMGQYSNFQPPLPSYEPPKPPPPPPPPK